MERTLIFEIQYQSDFGQSQESEMKLMTIHSYKIFCNLREADPSGLDMISKQVVI